MENINFRAWDSNDKEFFYFTIYDLAEESFDLGYFDLPQMYTGFGSIDDMPIFEGDFIECNEHVYLVKYGKFSINLTDYCHINIVGFYIDMSNGQTYLIENLYKIIGNIYENPELLKEIE